MYKKRTTAEFITESIKIFGNNKHDYSLVNYKNTFTKINIICIKHNVSFYQKPSEHLMGYNSCKQCKSENLSKPTKIAANSFIEKSNKIHNNKYNYSLVKYIGHGHDVDIICKIHGIFQQTPSCHLQGAGCQKCAKISFSIKRKEIACNQQEFIDRANLLYNFKYDYSLVNFISLTNKVKIICIKHNEIFEQLPRAHLNEISGCRSCVSEICSNNKKFDINDLIKEANIIHNNIYDYSNVIYIRDKTPVIIKCNKHGNFKQRMSVHIHDKLGCLKCKNEEIILIKNKIIDDWLIENNIPIKRMEICYSKEKQIEWQCLLCKGKFLSYTSTILDCSKCKLCCKNRSKSEIIIFNLLSKNNIKFKEQFPVKLPHNIKYYSYVDFYLPDYNLFIEYNGSQHYELKSVFYLNHCKTYNEAEEILAWQKMRDQNLKNYSKDIDRMLLQIDGRKYNSKTFIKYINNYINDLKQSSGA